MCAILIDRTASSGGDSTEDHYKALAASAIEGCADEQAVTLIYYFDQDRPGITPVGDQARYNLYRPEGRMVIKQDNQVDEEIDAANADVSAVFDDETDAERGSDVLQSLQAASESLRNRLSAEGVDEAYLIVISDGFQTGASLRVDELDGTTGPRDLSERAAELDLLPVLDGVSVTWAGVRSGDPGGESGGEVDDAFERDVKLFWTQVIEGGGGSLCSYTFDPDVLPVACVDEGD